MSSFSRKMDGFGSLTGPWQQGLELATAAPSLRLCSGRSPPAGPLPTPGLFTQLLRGFGPLGTCVNFLGLPQAKCLQIEWLRTTEIYSLTFRSQKSEIKVLAGPRSL